jgi:hypothetical protein
VQRVDGLTLLGRWAGSNPDPGPTASEATTASPDRAEWPYPIGLFDPSLDA